MAGRWRIPKEAPEGRGCGSLWSSVAWRLAGSQHAADDLCRQTRHAPGEIRQRQSPASQRRDVPVPLDRRHRRPLRQPRASPQPAVWWFIEDGDAYAAVRPLEANLRGGKTMLEKRTRHAVLYQDNVAADNITGIADADWIKARSGFVVEMGDKSEFGSFASFQDKILAGKVTADEADGFTRLHRLRARRPPPRHALACLHRRIRHPQDQRSRRPVAAVSAVSRVCRQRQRQACRERRDAHHNSPANPPGCSPVSLHAPGSPTNPTPTLLTLECPVGRVTCEGFHLGKFVTQTADGGIRIDADAEPSVLKLESKATAVSASFNGTAAETKRDAPGSWIIHTK